MNLTLEELAREAAATGFPGDTLEKVFHLMSLLDALYAHPFLKQHMALKGGTALNLFCLDVPRLSVDIDLNYVGPADRDAMLADRPKVEQAIQASCSREALATRRMPSEHAGGKWRLTYTSSAGHPGNLELDVNFMLRTPLWRPAHTECRPVGTFRASPVRMVDPHELAAGKLAALLARSASRDVFDARRLLREMPLDLRKLRLAFVVYGGINRKDWRTVSPADVQGDPARMLHELVPSLRADLAPARGDLGRWTQTLVAECRDLLSVVLPLTPKEVEFMRRLNDHGEIVAELLTGDEEEQTTIRNHPGLRWKALNVQKHSRGLS